MKIKKYTTQNGTRYKFGIRLGDKTTTRCGFITQTEAIREYTRLKDEEERKVTNQKTFYEVYEEWLEIYRTKVKDSTFYKTERVFYNHIFPYFYKQYIHEITPRDCQQFIMDCSAYVRGREYFNQAKKVAVYAQKMGYIKENPFNNVIEPKFKKGTVQKNYLEIDEVKKLLDYYKDNLYWHTLFRLMIFTGIRRGEVLSLEWDDVNFKKNTISINKTLSLGINNKPYVSSTKTERSNRVLLVDDITMELLKQLKEKSKYDIVFPSQSGKHARLGNIGDKLNKAIKDTGISNVRVHDLRHTHATLLFSSGANAKEVQERLGHADIFTTMNIYTHVTNDNTRKTLNRFIDLMDGGSC